MDKLDREVPNPEDRLEPSKDPRTELGKSETAEMYCSIPVT